MKRRLFLILIALIFVFNTFSYAKTKQKTNTKKKEKSIISKIHTSTDSILVADFETSKTIFAKRPFERQAINGLSKLMVFLVAMDEITLNKEKQLNDKIIISSKDIQLKDKIGIKEGDIFTLETLIKIMLATDNKAAPRAIAHHFSPSEEIFVKKMNSKAKKIGLIDTKFYNTTGDMINGKYNYSTAFDLYKLSTYILKKHPILLYYTGQKSVTLDSKKITIKSNISDILNSITSADGLSKTHNKQGEVSSIGTYTIEKSKDNSYRIIAITLKSKKKTKGIQKSIYDYVNETIKSIDINKTYNLPINSKKNTKKEKPTSIRWVIYKLFN